MKILIVSQYFWPESFIINDLAKTLRDQGHTIVVATGKPNYPGGTIYDGYTSNKVQEEIYSKDIKVIRVPLRPRKNGSAINLVLNYISFVFSGLFYFRKILKNYEFDVILVFGLSPITQAIPAIYLKWKTKSHLAIWVQDLWPESLAATGFIRNPLLLKIVGYMVKFIYSKMDTILIQSRGFYNAISKYTNADKIKYYPNSFLINNKNIPESLPSSLLWELENNFCIVFAGNIGKAQSVSTIIGAAQLLKDLVDVKILFIGSGSMLDWLNHKIKELNLENVVIVGRFPMGVMPSIYKRASALLVTLKNEDIFKMTIPSKIQAYLSTGKPIIASLNGEGARVIHDSGAGLTCKAESVEELAQCVRTIYKMNEVERLQMGEAGYKYFSEHFEMTLQAKNLINLLNDRILQTGEHQL